jgi:hypothetical protein
MVMVLGSIRYGVKTSIPSRSRPQMADRRRWPCSPIIVIIVVAMAVVLLGSVGVLGLVWMEGLGGLAGLVEIREACQEG